jgi:hypothetical protein
MMSSPPKSPSNTPITKEPFSSILNRVDKGNNKPPTSFAAGPIKSICYQLSEEMKTKLNGLNKEKDRLSKERKLLEEAITDTARAISAIEALLERLEDGKRPPRNDEGALRRVLQE